MNEPGREGADEAAPAGVVLVGHPLVQRLGIGEVLLHHGVEQPLVEIGGRTLDLVFKRTARQDMSGAHAIEAALHERIVRIGDPLTGLDQKVDDFRQRNIEQRRHFGARMHDPVQVDLGGREIDAEIARSMNGIVAFNQLATRKKRRGNRGCRIARRILLEVNHRVHATPLTYASTVPAHPILSSPSRSAYRTILSRIDGPLLPQAQGLKSIDILSPEMTPPQRPSSDKSKNAPRPFILTIDHGQEVVACLVEDSAAPPTAARDNGRPPGSAACRNAVPACCSSDSCAPAGC